MRISSRNKPIKFVIATFSLILTSLTQADALSNNPSPDCSAITSCSISFPYTGDVYNWTVPGGVNSISFDVRGAQGGDGKSGSTTNSYGGQGGVTTGTLTVSPGQLLVLRVGGRGSNGNAVAGGFNGGGATNASSSGVPGSGGGASDIRIATDTFTARVVVAGGGGGASGFCASASSGDGGAGGGATGGAGGGDAGCWNAARGGGGTQSAGGAALGINYSVAGSLGVGGTGKGWSDGGGGGGGGYYGGGGATVGAGGGGSSYVHPTLVTSSSLSRGGRTGDGLITLTYSLPVSTSISLSTSGNITRLVKGISVDVSISATNTPGKFTLYLNGKKVPGCISRPITATAICAVKPAVNGSYFLFANFIPNSSSYVASTSSSTLVTVTKRGTQR